MTTRSKWHGLLIRRECWKLSWRAKLLLALLMVIGALVLRNNLYPFLAITQPVQAEYLVVEGWTPGTALGQVPAIFHAGNYRMVLTVGSDRHAPGSPEAISTYAGYAAACLRALGMPEHVIVAVPSESVAKDRTYHSALAVRAWLHNQGKTNASLNILTAGAHARRSRLLFDKAFQSKTKVGVIAAQERTFDPQLWWRSSQGFRDVTGEALAYAYARLVFFPLHLRE